MLRARVLTIRNPLLVLSVILFLAGISGRAQLDGNASGKDANAAQASSEDIIPFLNQTIVWSRQLTAEQQLVSEPSDALFLNDSRQVADQVVKLAFDFARARAQVLASQTDAAFRERWALFWFNHFTVGQKNLQTAVLAGPFERGGSLWHESFGATQWLPPSAH